MTFNISKKRKYSFHHTVFSHKVDYERYFLFFDLNELEGISNFTYFIMENGNQILGPFNFKSSVSSGNSFKMVAFGDHDLAGGMKTIYSLED